MKDVAFIVYTHSTYSDIWPIFFGQTKKHLKFPFKKYIFVDKVMPGIPEEYEVILYTQNHYTTDVAHCLSQIKDKHKYCLFQHEDMFLYSDADTRKLIEYFNVMKQEDLDSLRLIKAGPTRDVPVPANRELKLILRSSPWIFSIQPSFWKTEELYKIYNTTPGDSIWEFELAAQKTVKVNSTRIVYPDRGEPKRGKQHYDSYTYPYIATAVFKGRWMMSEYTAELVPLLKEYNIDPQIRGII